MDGSFCCLLVGQLLSTIMGFFTAPMEGKIMYEPFKKMTFSIAQECAKECMKYSEVKCLGFHYDYSGSLACELLEAVLGHGVTIHKVREGCIMTTPGLGMQTVGGRIRPRSENT